ncbi:unnamed protein product [Echinostoma caproni]|uniref:Endoplasmic reticulum-Golgi intermediate compartment protein 3 n=1 Tax=Echinostoma caproni TaxID=27848 RepID=A0A183ASI3_9TREM|nr:unnamed protein product [Echinostoma caproni]
MLTSTFLSQFDAFAKPLKDFRVKTVAGAIVSIFSCLSIFCLFISELFLYLTPQLKQEIMVDVNRGEKLSITLDITYLQIPCVIRFSDGRSTPFSSSRCCNTCKEVQQAYYEKNWVVTNMTMFRQCQKENWASEVSKLGKEGCRIQGQLQVNKVAGSFHISPGNSYAVNHVHVHHLQNIGTNQVSSMGFFLILSSYKADLISLVFLLLSHLKLCHLILYFCSRHELVISFCWISALGWLLLSNVIYLSGIRSYSFDICHRILSLPPLALYSPASLK